jgi:3D (Asp-Asp-Asp) domain-containing protein
MRKALMVALSLGIAGGCDSLVCEPLIVSTKTILKESKPIPPIQVPQVEPTPVIVKENPKYKIIRVKCYSYCPCSRCTPGSGKTSTGGNAWQPGIAVDPRVIPLGSTIEVPGYERATQAFADDTGRDIKGYTIDVRMTYHWQARQWGVQYLDIKVYQ